MLKRFSGGVHPSEKKHTENKAIEIMPAPKRVFIPFSQHAGKPARPLVKKDDLVKMGTKIGEADGFISSPIHASVAGRVAGIQEYPHPVLGSCLSCVIEAGDDDDWIPEIEGERDWEKLSNEEMLKIIKDAGIVGMGGAAFPTHVKLAPPPEKTIDTLIINGCECEPMLTADHRLMLEHTPEIIEGARIFQKILGAKELIFGVEDNKKDAVEELRKQDIEVQVLKTKYPQGAEKQLIKALRHREVPRGGLPMDVGCVVQNVGTCYAASHAVRYKKPLIDRVVTVTGDGIKETKNVLARIGTTVLDVIDFCGGYVVTPKRIVCGGPMMGISQFTDQVPLVKGTSGIIVWTTVKPETEKPCVRCARCVDACPMGLMPTELYKSIKVKNFNQAKDLGVLDCIECGCCAYACPAAIPLVHYLKFGKAEVWRMAKK